jgi:hypothetical protein
VPSPSVTYEILCRIHLFAHPIQNPQFFGGGEPGKTLNAPKNEPSS